MKWIYPRDGSDPYPADERTAAAGGLLVIGDSHYDIGDPRFHSRATHREYMRAHGLSLVDEHKADWDRAAERRAEYFTRATDPNVKADVARAFEQVRAGYRPKRVSDLP